MDFELVTDGLRFPEGPIAMNDGSVIVTEIKGGALTRVTPDGRKTIVAETGGGPNGAAIGPDGAIYVCNNGAAFTWRERDGVTMPSFTPPGHKGGSIQRVDIATGKVTTVYDSCDGKGLLSPNDIVFDRTGGFWFSDHGVTTPDGRNFGALCYARPDGSHIVRARKHMISPNGVGLSPDESVVYVADTQLARLWAFDITAPGELKKPEGFGLGRVAFNAPGYEYFDSLAVEANGRVCVATVFNNGITSVGLDGSTEHFDFPDPFTTNICFGGADMRDAWVTCSSTGKLYRARWPRPGLKLNFNA